VSPWVGSGSPATHIRRPFLPRLAARYRALAMGRLRAVDQVVAHDGHDRARAWWSDAVVYQLYVRSWHDSDGDGYAIFPGWSTSLTTSPARRRRLWLSPTMPSPGPHDWGYDVSDYVSVHPELGSLEDMDRLVAEQAADRCGSCSTWCQPHERPAPVVCRGPQLRGATHRNWYVWAEPSPDKAPPNNWLDASGESAWTLDAETGQYYLHNFLPSQPDLNWWDPPVHDAFEESSASGLTGYCRVPHRRRTRLYKDAALRDNPPMPEGQLIGGTGGQEQRFSANRPETHAVFRNWRRIAEQYEPQGFCSGDLRSGRGEARPLLRAGRRATAGLQTSRSWSRYTALELSNVVRENLVDSRSGPPGLDHVESRQVAFHYPVVL